jgi:hypothetical protein
MDGPTGTEQDDNKAPYTTSKQVQAWFLKRSRDRWKKKATRNNAELKRLRQRVADVDASRDHWRQQAESARREADRLRSVRDELQDRLDRQDEDASQKKRTPSPA